MKRILLFSLLCVFSAGIFWSCSKEESFETDQDLALGSLHDSTDECYPISVSGTYYNGINAARDTNTVMLYVNVTQAGSYTISSSTENGFSFSDTGFFSTVGLDSIRLQASGTPILIKPTDFTVSFNQTSCSFTVNVLDSTGTGLSGSDPGTGGGTDTTVSDGNYGSTYVDPSPAATNTWHFTDSITKKTYSGTSFPVSLEVFNFSNGLNLGVTGATSDLKNFFSAAVNFPSTGGAVGSYPLKDGGGSIQLVSPTLPAATLIYYGDGTSAKEDVDPSYINLTTFDLPGKKVAGSFRCWATNEAGTLTLLKGSFNTIFQ